MRRIHNVNGTKHNEVAMKATDLTKFACEFCQATVDVDIEKSSQRALCYGYMIVEDWSENT